MSNKQIQGPGGAPDFAKGSTAPKGVHSHERAQAKNTLDQARGLPPNSGQTAGGSRQGGKKGSGGE